jgi:hypothetical protein
MPPVLIALHVLASMVWLVSSLALSWGRGLTSSIMFRVQMLAATVAVFAGGGLWSMRHRGGFGPSEMILAAGALCAILAAGVQGGLVGGSVRRLASGALGEAEARARMQRGQRIAAGLLTVALLAMMAAPHA